MTLNTGSGSDPTERFTPLTKNIGIPRGLSGRKGRACTPRVIRDGNLRQIAKQTRRNFRVRAESCAVSGSNAGNSRNISGNKRERGGGGGDGKRGGRACERAGTGRQGGPCSLGLLQAPRLRRRQSAGPFSLTAKRGLRLFAILSASAQSRPWPPSRPNSRGLRSCVETREMFTIRGTIDDIFISSLTLDRPGLSSRLFFPQIHRRSSESSRAFLLAPHFLARRTREFG